MPDRAIQDIVPARADGGPALSRHARWRKRRLERAGGAPRVAGRLGVIAGGVAVAAVATAHLWLLVPAALLALATAAVAAIPLAQTMLVLPGGDGSHAAIGLGATVSADAVVEPGARVEIGATVCSGATIRAGAVVGMGATVQEDATVEANASVGWGATVGRGALVRRGARIGAGATVHSEAEIPENARVGAGGTVARGKTGARPTDALPAGGGPASANVDPRDVRIDVLCDQIESELGRVSMNMDEIIRQPRETIESVRRTCHDLLRRERALRRLVDPVEQERLAREAASMTTRIASEKDEVTRQHLQGALTALEEHCRQRDLLERDVNRLEARQTRLVWTMEGLLAHVVRLRTTEGAGDTELGSGLTQLREEVAALTEAIDHVQSEDVLAPSGTAAALPETATRPAPIVTPAPSEAEPDRSPGQIRLRS